MKKGGLISFLLLAILVTNNLSQSNSRGFVCKPVKLISNVRQKAAYYISISRADAGQFSKKEMAANRQHFKARRHLGIFCRSPIIASFQSASKGVADDPHQSPLARCWR